jgi:hypothetical protein
MTWLLSVLPLARATATVERRYITKKWCVLGTNAAMAIVFLMLSKSKVSLKCCLCTGQPGHVNSASAVGRGCIKKMPPGGGGRGRERKQANVTKCTAAS